MTKFTRFLILTVLIASAILCYLAGSTTGTIAFFVLGGSLEFFFWFGLLKGFGKRSR